MLRNMDCRAVSSLRPVAIERAVRIPELTAERGANANTTLRPWMWVSTCASRSQAESYRHRADVSVYISARNGWLQQAAHICRENGCSIAAPKDDEEGVKGSFVDEVPVSNNEMPRT
ncbi:hypothetical protein MTO96_021403 [Rhipicephalus appendiculatus]